MDEKIENEIADAMMDAFGARVSEDYDSGVSDSEIVTLVSELSSEALEVWNAMSDEDKCIFFKSHI